MNANFDGIFTFYFHGNNCLTNSHVSLFKIMYNVANWLLVELLMSQKYAPVATFC